jgi:hypothetical protein
MIRYARYVVVALFALLAVALAALWVRSYWWMDYRVREVGGPQGLFVHSQQGQLRFFVFKHTPLPVSNRRPGAFDDLFRETFALPNSPHRIPAQWRARREVLCEFQWTHYPDGARFVVPHWFPAASSFGLAIRLQATLALQPADDHRRHDAPCWTAGAGSVRGSVKLDSRDWLRGSPDPPP